MEQGKPPAAEHLQDQGDKPVVDFQRTKSHLQHVSIYGVDMDIVRTYKYLGLKLDDRLNWTPNMDPL